MTQSARRCTFHLLRPPYHDLESIEHPESLPLSFGTTGAALVWCMGEQRTEHAVQVARSRRPGLSLIVVLPPADSVDRQDEIFRMIELCRPASVMPFHEEPHVDDLRTLLSAPPDDLPAAVVDYVRWRGIPLDLDIRRLVRRTLELSADLRSVNALARSVYLSRRALGRRFTNSGLPVPSHWLHAGRILRATLRIQEPDTTLAQIAYELGYPDGFALSNQMKRLTGMRPSDVRSRRGWEWMVECWLRREAMEGGFPDAAAKRVLGGERIARWVHIPAPSSTSRVGAPDAARRHATLPDRG
jgi:AraC-like DNA-binding protein